jgi:NADPH-dependent 2,4-dienoyl-CoA reductase/sulfur reductase-like enzyme
MPAVKYERITAEGLVVTTREGQSRTIEADTLVLATGAVPENKLAKELQDKSVELHVIGDCQQPRNILEAINDGARVGLEL